MVPPSLQVPRSKSSHPFPFGEKLDCMNHAVYQDKPESFDDYFQCIGENCKLKHVKNWLRFFVDYHNNELTTPK